MAVKTIKTINKENQILEYLLYNKQADRKEFKKDLGRDYKSIVRYIRSLEKEHYIQVVDTVNSKYGGLDKLIYGLTELGFYHTLAELEQIWEKLDIVAAQYPDTLPLLFGKIDFFKEQMVYDQVIKRFRKAILVHQLEHEKKLLEIRIQKNQIKKETVGKNSSPINNDNENFFENSLWFQNINQLTHFSSNITFSTFFSSNLSENENQSFLKTVSRDPDIDEYLESQFESLETVISGNLEVLRKWKSWYQDNSFGEGK